MPTIETMPIEEAEVAMAEAGQKIVAGGQKGVKT